MKDLTSMFEDYKNCSCYAVEEDIEDVIIAMDAFIPLALGIDDRLQVTRECLRDDVDRDDGFRLDLGYKVMGDSVRGVASILYDKNKEGAAIIIGKYAERRLTEYFDACDFIYEKLDK